MSTLAPIDVKELKMKLQAKKDERLRLVTSLGEKFYKHLLMKEGTEFQPNYDIVSILQCDKEIYRYSSTIARESKDLESCPSCQQTNAAHIKFCGNCGTLNPLFIEQQIEKVTCVTCEESIPAEYSFCPCCGTKQGEA